MMAKKLKAYEQWKQERQQERTPSPEREQPMELTCYKQEIPGKWCSMSVRVFGSSHFEAKSIG